MFVALALEPTARARGSPAYRRGATSPAWRSSGAPQPGPPAGYSAPHAGSTTPWQGPQDSRTFSSVRQSNGGLARTLQLLKRSNAGGDTGLELGGA